MKEKFIDSFIIGLCAGVIFYSLYNGTFGLVVLLPLVFIYKGIISKKNKKDKNER